MSETEDGLERRLSAAAERLPEIAARRRTARFLRIGFIVGVLLVVIGGLWMVWASARTNIVDRKDELATALQERATSTNLADRVSREAQATAGRVLPKLQKELEAAQAKIASTLPEILDTESKGLDSRVRRSMDETLNRTLNEMKVRQREVLMANFGEFLDCKPDDAKDVCKRKQEQVDRLMNEVTEAYHEWAVTQMTTTFNAHLNALGDIHETIAGLAKKGADAGDATAQAAKTGAAPSDMLMIFVEAAGDALGASEAPFGSEGPTLEGDEPELPTGADTPAVDTPTPTEGAAPAPVEGATPPPTEGAAPAPTEGAAPAPTEGAAPAPTEGAPPAPSGSAPPPPPPPPGQP